MTRNEFIAHVEREQEALRSFLLALCCGNKNEADDLAQDSLVTETLDEARTLISPHATDDSFEHQDLYLALRTLPPKERSAITLYYLNGYDIKEIAAITDTSEDAVKKQLSRGRDKLKARLKL